MEKMTFKTNINCSGCVAAVKPSLDKAAGEGTWSVDTSNAEKLLTIDANESNEAAILKAVKEAGYKIIRKA